LSRKRVIMPFKNNVKSAVMLLVILACSSSDIMEIDYKDPDTTIDYAGQFAESMVGINKLKEAEEAYNWIRSKDSLAFNTRYKEKLIDLYGLQGRYEKQLELYGSIFTSDSVDNSQYVPHFYNSVGMSYFERSKIPLINGQLDTSLIRLAIDNFVKCYAYTLHKDPEIQSRSRYFAGLAYSKMGNFDKSLEMFEFIVDSMRGTKVHPKAFFKEKDYTDYHDIEVTSDMMRQYDEAYQFVKAQDDVKSLQEKSDELSRQPVVDSAATQENMPKAEENADQPPSEDSSDDLPEPVNAKVDSVAVDSLQSDN
ncbi:MAG: hypothetical protein KDD94_14560, partial [Calditrichaeota bacterium]|nr:hypothetical protein [Calditrichota bacterium]